MEAVAGTSRYYYDGNGNMVQVLPSGVNVGGEGEKLYDFNQRNLLIHHEETLGIFLGYPGFVDYVYDGNGDRVQQVVRETGYTPIITTTYANDPLGLTQVLLADNGTTQTAQLYGLDLIGQDDIGQGSKEKAMRLLLADGLGSVRQEMVGGVVQTTTTYGPYGNLLAQTGSSGTVYGYTGEQEDAATGLVYLRARYYNPYLNQFMSRDPFPGYDNLPASQNGYNYTHANPVNYTDPTGHCIELVSGAICVGTGVIVVGTVAIVGGTVIAVNNIVNDRPALDFSGMPPAPDWMVDNFYVLDDLQQWIENYPLLENSAPYFGSFPLLQPQLNIPTGFDLVKDSCWLEQFSPASQIPRLPGFDLQQNIDPQILMSRVQRIGTPPVGRNIVEIPIDKLNPIHNVPRAGVPKEHIESIAQSIAQNGYDLSLPVSATRLPDGQLIVTGGHHRLAAMQALGENTVPVQVFDAVNTPPERLAKFLGIGRITGKYGGTYYPDLNSEQLSEVRSYLQAWKVHNSEQIEFDFLP